MANNYVSVDCLFNVAIVALIWFLFIDCRDKFPTARCEYYSHMGWCNKNGQIRNNCYNTCVCNQVQSETTKKPNILVCKDDQRFDRLCSRFGSDCTSTGSLGKSLRRYCPKTCNICCKRLFSF